MNFSQVPELTNEQLTEVWVAAHRALPERWIADPRQSHQFADYHDRRMPEWLSAFAQGTMLDLGHMALMLQGVIEGGMAIKLDVATYRAASHFVMMGICTADGRTLQ